MAEEVVIWILFDSVGLVIVQVLKVALMVLEIIMINGRNNWR